MPATMPSWPRFPREPRPRGARWNVRAGASGACLRGAFLVVATIFGVACSGKTILAVEPFPCPDASANGCPPGLLDDLVGFWRLNDGTGSSTVHDSSGWANDGKLVDITAGTAWVADGPEKTAFAPQGKGYVEIPGSSSIDTISKQVTMAAWIYVDGDPKDFSTAISRQTGTDYGQLYHLSLTKELHPAVFITPASGQIPIYATTTVVKNTWAHLAATYDGKTVRLYLDGQEVASTPAPTVGSTFNAETNPVVLGGNANGGNKTVSELVNGRLDDVMLYRRALSAADIARIYNGALLR